MEDAGGAVGGGFINTDGGAFSITFDGIIGEPLLGSGNCHVLGLVIISLNGAPASGGT
jgi:hypothetical protein